jgi:hypothetical protein
MAVVVNPPKDSTNPGAGVTVTNDPLDTVAAETGSPELLRPDIEEQVIKMKPSSTPIDQILRHATNKSTDSMEFGYYAVDQRPEKSSLSKNIDLSDIERNIISAADNDLFDVSDTILFPDVFPNSDGKPLVVRVVSKTDDGYLVVVALNGVKSATGKVVLPKVTKGAIMVRMGRAAGELDVQSPSLEALPERLTNYCQIFKVQIEESILFADHKKEAKWNFSDLDENAFYDFRRGMEKSFLFGVKAKIFDSVQKQNIWTTEGIWWQTNKEFHYTEATFTQATLIDVCKAAFIGNNGNNRRILIGGSDLISMISKLQVQKQLSAKDTEVKWGITWNVIVTNFGTLYVLHDEVFDQVGMPGNGYILDPEYLTKRIYKPLNRLDLELVKSGQRNTNARVLTEISGVILKYPDAHMKIIRDEEDIDTDTSSTGAGEPE